MKDKKLFTAIKDFFRKYQENAKTNSAKVKCRTREKSIILKIKIKTGIGETSDHRGPEKRCTISEKAESTSNKPRQRGKWCKTTKSCVLLSPKCFGNKRGKKENCEGEKKKDIYDIFSERPKARRDISQWMSPEQQHSVSKI